MPRARIWVCPDGHVVIQRFATSATPQQIAEACAKLALVTDVIPPGTTVEDVDVSDVDTLDGRLPISGGKLDKTNRNKWRNQGGVIRVDPLATIPERVLPKLI